MKKIGLHCIFLLFIALSVAQTTSKTVIAAKGDGVYSLLRNYGLDPVRFHKAFIALNKNKLGPKNKLYVGHTYQLPIIDESVDLLIDEKTTVTSTTTERKPESDSSYTFLSLFGKDNDSVVIKDTKLKGATYYLISGHGGPDPGAVAKYDDRIISEDEYAYDVTLRLAKKLLAHGAEVHIIIKDPDDGIRDERILTIDHDEISYSDKAIPRNQKSRLKQRTDEVNTLYRQQKGYRRLIVTHVDSRSTNKNIDVFFYHHKLSKNGKRLAQNLEKTFRKKYAQYQPNRDYSGSISSRSSLYLIKNTFPAMAYIELGNIRNKKDQKRILDHDNRDAMAKWITEGLILDFNQE